MVITRSKGKTIVGVRGPETRSSSAAIPPDSEFFGIVFKHGAFMPRLPTWRLVNGARGFREVTRRSFELEGAAWELPTFDNADTFLDRLVRKGVLTFDGIVDATARGEATPSSSRTVRRHWLRTTGLTQGVVQRIDRARQATALLQRGMPILETVHQLGYFDQAHLTRSLNRFIGHTPAELLRLGEDLALSLSHEAKEFARPSDGSRRRKKR